MTDKLFYTDPLIAAYMASSFEVYYKDVKCAKAQPFLAQVGHCIHPYDDKIECIVDVRTGLERLYIHPDSYHIFEPQFLDMVTNIGSQGWLVVSIEGDKLIHEGKMHSKKGEVKIIQREGKHFFMPESE